MSMSPRLLRPRESFTPRSISGLALWLDASDASKVTKNGTNVSQWQDKSGSGLSLTQSTAANQPAFIDSAVNGRPAVEFDALESMAFASSTASFNYLHNSTGATIFLVVKPDLASDPNAIRYFFNNNSNTSANTGLSVYFDDRSSVSRNNAFAVSVTRAVSGQSTSNIVANNFFAAANAFAVVTIALDNANATAGSRIALYRNGTASSEANTLTYAASSGNASANLTFGNFGGGSAGGTFAEILFYQGILSASNRSSVQRYLGRRYGVSVA